MSLDSTIRSNVSVGLPIDLALMRTDTLRIDERMRLDENTPLYAEIHDTWSRKLENAVRSLPRFPWEAGGDAASRTSSLVGATAIEPGTASAQAQQQQRTDADWTTREI